MLFREAWPIGRFGTATLLTVVVFAMACGGDSGRGEAEREYDRAEELLAQGSVRKAGEAYNVALGLYPDYAEAYVGRGRVFLEFDNTVSAVADLDRAISLDPGLATAYSYRGVAHMTIGDTSSAMLDLTKAIEVDRFLVDAHVFRARLSARDDNLESAIVDMGSAISLRPRSDVLYMERAQMYLAVGDVGGAIADLEEVLSLSQDETAQDQAKRLLVQLGAGR
jgi:FimV-like protein